MLKPVNESLNPFVGANQIMYLPDLEENGLVIKQYRPKPISKKMIKYRLVSWWIRPIPVEYQRPIERRSFEISCLTLWRSKGFRVPMMLPVPDRCADLEPCLGLEYIDGERLDAYLREPERNIQDKLSVLRTIFKQMHKRHNLAIEENDHRLIHFDVNLGNVIIQDHQPIHIDFESGHLNEPIERSAAREILVLGLDTVNLLGKDQWADITKLIIEDYAIEYVLHNIVKNVLKTPFQGIHRRNDRKRKIAKPELITKFDLAWAIEKTLTIN